ncbi:hypothetical protein B0H19DRAFT_1235272 [Mycena capillaripes]|nr:hypothetical protein B0H19DRAFT_1235272 [Mycena capillaripes]
MAILVSKYIEAAERVKVASVLRGKGLVLASFFQEMGKCERHHLRIRRDRRERARERGKRTREESERRGGGLVKWSTRGSVGILGDGEHMQALGVKHTAPPAIPGSERADEEGRRLLVEHPPSAATTQYRLRDAHPWSVGGARGLFGRDPGSVGVFG